MISSYDRNDRDGIIEYARRLIGLTLRDACGYSVENHTFSGKGMFGQLLEKYYFGYEPNSVSEPDFKEAGLELKSTPLKRLQSGELASKERVVLGIIDYPGIISEEFLGSAFYCKNSNLLLVFYIHEKDKASIDYYIDLVDTWDFPDDDLEIIKKDWEAIKRKVEAGLAHELSEGDTFYLGASTKGANASSLRVQPNNESLAKQRAYSLKQGYVNHIYRSMSDKDHNRYSRLPRPSPTISIEDYVLGCFSKHIGKTLDTLIKEFGIRLNTKAKGFYASLTNAILGVELGKQIEEFEKAEIIVRTVRLDPDGKPKEDMSFPVFRFTDLIHEEWSTSDFHAYLEHKFLFIFYRYVEDVLYLDKVTFWNMSNKDKEDAREVWETMQDLISEGRIVRELKGTRRSTYFPSSTSNRVAHVRPHARNAMDTYPLPFPDRLTGAMEYTKHCFWLNRGYIRDAIYRP